VDLLETGNTAAPGGDRLKSCSCHHWPWAALPWVPGRFTRAGYQTARAV